jgi:hypothetical protein
MSIKTFHYTTIFWTFLWHVLSAVWFAPCKTWSWPLQFTSEIRNEWSLTWRSKLPVAHLTKFEVSSAVLMTAKVFCGDKGYRVIVDVSERRGALFLQVKTVRMKALHCFKMSVASRYTVHPRKIEIFIYRSIVVLEFCVGPFGNSEVVRPPFLWSLVVTKLQH